MTIDSIVNCVRINDRMITAGQPSESELSDVRDLGFSVVINLGIQDPRYCLDDEYETVTDLGMKYHHIPVEFDAPESSQLDEFIALIDSYSGSNIFIHCAANYRVSCFVSLYSQSRLGWTAIDADSYIESIWTPDDVWSDFVKESRQRLRLEGA